MLWIDPYSRTFVIFFCNRYGGSGADTRPAVYRMHHRISTLAAEGLKGVDFTQATSPEPTRRDFAILGEPECPCASVRSAKAEKQTAA